MSYPSPALVRAATLVSLGAFVTFGSAPAFAQTLTNVSVRVMASNLSSGNNSRYESPGLNILKGLRPDIVAMQEFNVSNGFGANTPAALSNMVATTFGTNFVYFREPYSASGDIPNGIISHWPILESGSWADPVVSNRGFAWVRIDLPGANDLYVVSVHLYSSGTATDRNTEATIIKNQIAASFPSGAWVIVAGDFNTATRSEAAVTTFKTFLSDSPIPADQAGNPNTSAPRTKPYDFVLPSFSLTNCLVAVTVGNQSFPNGLVFDSRVYNPLSEVPPVQTNDSAAVNMQHMGVVKDFRVTYTVTNPATPPEITTQPQDQMVNQAASATFNVTATGTPTPSFQWRFNGTNLAGATASSYTVPSVQPSNLGAYSVGVTNSASGIVSSNAAMRLIVPAPTLDPSSPRLLRWQGLSNLTYTIQNRTNLALGDWHTLGGTSSPNGTLVFPLPDTNAPQNFFRVVYP